MESPSFTIEQEHRGAVHILRLTGYLDASTSHILDEALQNILSSSDTHTLIDCEHLTYISSAGLGMFMKHIDAIRNAGGDIIFCSMQKPVFNVFDLLGFPILYKIFNEQSEALSHYSGILGE